MKTLNILSSEFARVARTVFLALAALGIVACSGGSSQPVEQNDNFSRADGDQGIQYTGPTASTDDVQNYKLNIGMPIRLEVNSTRCQLKI